MVTKLREYTDLPIAVGFGIRDSAQIQALAKKVELIVVGTKLVETLHLYGVSATINQIKEYAEILENRRSQ
ncbi:hypothetical protein BJL95_20385 [Methylomonas sp. LWB]|uniref:tryptophan synthase subunit alpha n=1 Tax=Methylomonas sp. LWB TaxID=1905845 RepID=UPI0008DAA200|nr:hypothetical protein BJL95_20385 [Methylomonas sp. LWB]